MRAKVLILTDNQVY